MGKMCAGAAVRDADGTVGEFADTSGRRSET